MTLRFEPIRVATGHDETGMLVLAEERLVAVLVQLSEEHDGLQGQWFFETGYGRLAGPDQPIFADLAAAEDWIEYRLGARRGE